MYACYEAVVIEYRVIALGPGAEFELDQEAAHTDFQGPLTPQHNLPEAEVGQGGQRLSRDPAILW